ncbi:hypothetical protein [Methanospirillum lacunae]|uniref:Glycosyltransferase RgtA/B/C/D-like domain-containing protein n=1 Tax=Methanospirillum lacunae TaxID=668570 RepID=A0A2V2N689_9EURY|nr:hypothetical protein [Methanospirillum lacunae]PWR74015.1 hypothetical protein DK846_02295 [Methanospirillum lacunae]
MIKKSIYGHFSFFDTKEKLFQLGLLFAIIIGFYYKLLSYSNIILDSDSAQFGLYSYSMAHGNILFHEMYLSSSGKYFLELLIFHLFPQFLSNYDPIILKLSLFLIFALTVFIFSFFVYYITKKITSALIFAALFVSLNSSAFSSFADISHMFSVLFCGLALIFTCYFISKNHEQNYILKSLILIIIFSFCISIASYSDPYVILCYTMPIIGAYLFFFNNKTKITNLFFIFVATFSLICYLFGDWIIQTIIPDPPRIIPYMPLEMQPFTHIIPYILFFLEGFSRILNNNLYQLWDGFTIENIGVSIVIIAIFVYLLSIYLVHRNLIIFKNKFFSAYLILAFMVFFIFYVFTSMSAEGLSHQKYLLYPIIVVLLLISLSYSSKNQIFTILICLFICFGLIGNFYSNPKFEIDSNQNQTELIDFLKNNSLYYGYSDYWDSNLITYLSKFDVTVRALTIDGNESVQTYPYNNNDNWYNYPDGADVFILTRKENTLLTDESLAHVLDIDPPKKVMHSNEYTIYVW